MFRVGTSFIFSKIKSRSASVTLNLICIVRFLPSMFSLLSVPRVWDTSQQAVFNRRAAAREGENTERVPLSYACYESFSLLPTTELHPILPNFRKRKTLQSQKKITTLLKSCSVLPDTSYLPSCSTLAISSAVAVTIRMPVSLISSRSASSCRRFVSFPAGLSKRNWSTDIL